MKSFSYRLLHFPCKELRPMSKYEHIQRTRAFKSTYLYSRKSGKMEGNRPSPFARHPDLAGFIAHKTCKPISYY